MTLIRLLNFEDFTKKNETTYEATGVIKYQNDNDRVRLSFTCISNSRCKIKEGSCKDGSSFSRSYIEYTMKNGGK